MTKVNESLVFNATNEPTRAGELVATQSDIQNIPSPRVGMIVYVQDEKKNYIVLTLKEKEVSGVMYPDAQVDEYEELNAALDAAIKGENARATTAEAQLSESITTLGEAFAEEISREHDERVSSDNTIKAMAVKTQFSTRNTDAEKVVIDYMSLDDKVSGEIHISAATQDTAGVMSAEDKTKLDSVGQRQSINIVSNAYIDYKIELPKGSVITDLGGYDGQLLLSTAYPFDVNSRISINKDLLPFYVPIDVQTIRSSKDIDTTIVIETGLRAASLDVKKSRAFKYFFTATGIPALAATPITSIVVMDKGRVLTSVQGTTLPKYLWLGVDGSTIDDATKIAITELPFVLPFDVKKLWLDVSTIGNPIDIYTIDAESEEYRELLQNKDIKKRDDGFNQISNEIENIKNGTTLVGKALEIGKEEKTFELKLDAYVSKQISLKKGTIITDFGSYNSNLLASPSGDYATPYYVIPKNSLPYVLPEDITYVRVTESADTTITYIDGLVDYIDKVVDEEVVLYAIASGYSAFGLVVNIGNYNALKKGRVLTNISGVEVDDNVVVRLYDAKTVAESINKVEIKGYQLPYILPFDVASLQISVSTKSNPVTFVTNSYQKYATEILSKEIELDINNINERISSLENLYPNNTYVFPQQKGNMLDGTVLELEKNSVRTFKSLAFSADVASFGTESKLLLGHGRESEKRYGASWVEITSTSVSVKMWYAADNIKTVTYEHGLTINGNIQVLLSVDTGALTLKMASCGNVFEKTDIEWNTNGKIFAESKGCELTDASLSWNCKNFTADIWAFGDSYFGTTNTERWIKHLLDAGYHNILINGYAGEAGTDALADLNALLQHGTPKYIFWCQGMNNADTSTAVNSTWESVLESVKGICAAKNIELVLATIPTVPSRVHKYKNAIVRSSGYRYVDFDKAVGANESTGAWFNGMLSGDGVHPSTKGAVALFHKALADFPELMMAKRMKL